MSSRSLAAAAVLLLGRCLAVAESPPAPRLVADPDDLTSRGALIVLCNCDDNDGNDNRGDGSPDNTDEFLIGREELRQLTPFRIHAAKGASAGPLTLKLRNAVPDATAPEKKFRLFVARQLPGRHPPDIPHYGSIAAWGKRCAEYTLSDEDLELLANGDMVFYVEGMDFAVETTLELLQGTSKVDELALQTAPLLLLPHTQLPLSSMVVKVDPARWNVAWAIDSPRYVADYRRMCDEAVAASPRLSGLILPRVLEVDHADIWIEDELQWGYTETPHCRMPVALHMRRARDLEKEVAALLGPGVGYYRNGPEANSLNYGGNLEVTPPTEEWPWGRIYYGAEPSPPGRDNSPRYIDPKLEAFFKRQKADPSDAHALQEPVRLNTDWLTVGHVDEIVTFVPANNQRGFVLLWASPSRAWEVLRDVSASQRADPHYLDPAKAPDSPRYTFFIPRSGGALTLETLLDLDWRKIDPSVGNFLGTQSIADYNRKIEMKIRSNVEKLKAALQLSDDEIKPVPVLYCNHSSIDQSGRVALLTYYAADAITPGMVNLSSFDRMCVVPDPLIPAFQDDFRKTLEEAGLKTNFIDDWAVYHVRLGEVHCGSNTQRQPFERKWWSPKNTRRQDMTDESAPLHRGARPVGG